jgi:radical SAM protein with 4Fe4S-binding SPASM domain
MAVAAQNRRRIAADGLASSCYFRTSTVAPDRKALVQITERCNLHCAHCFVSAGREGLDLTLGQLRDQVLPQLRAARVTRLTLTGGEPFAHPHLLEVVRHGRQLGMTVTLCTNGTLVEPDMMDALVALGGVRLNVSLDGLSATGHGKFRGSPRSFDQTVATVRALGERGLLKGILATPNSLAELHEYSELCAFARSCGAEYVLMNPLASMGRGVGSQRRLAISDDQLRAIREETSALAGDDLDVVHIRFPNDDEPLSGCEAGTIVYVFATGDVTVCPYLVFAARTPRSQHRAEEFIVGNALEHDDIPRRLDAYRLHDRGIAPADPLCGSCDLAERCGRGCPAAVIAAGGRLGDRDTEQCPRTADDMAAT